MKFNWDNFKLNQDKKIVQLGFWLRKLHSIKHLKADGYRKIWIAAHDYARLKRDNEAEAMDTYNEYGLDHIGLYEEWDLLDNLEYDHLLSENIIFLDLYDASANNVVVECIVRNTPILVNRTPGVVEHLGPDYPLFFDSLDEASEKIKDEAVVHDAHVYLGNMDKAQYDFGYFTETFTTSGIYTDLPAPGKHAQLELDRPPIDTLNDLNVISGSGLKNDFVFVICFRNQSRKILRCLQSVTDKISKKHNAGIVLIDDASEDEGLDLAIEHLSGLNVDFVAVKNPERKHHPRNLYNAVTLLVENKESVVIEVDGDDYLEQVDLLKILKKTYKKGVLQTFGCCRHAPGSDFVNEFADVENHIFDDISSPWNMDKCLPWLPLKTYKKSLFNEVPLHCFHEKNGTDWLKTGENLQCHPMMTSLAGKAVRFIDKILYVCDFSGPHHDIYHTDRARYLIENLYRLPSGRFIGNCWTKIRNENAGNSHVASIGPRLGSVPKVQSGS